MRSRLSVQHHRGRNGQPRRCDVNGRVRKGRDPSARWSKRAISTTASSPTATRRSGSRHVSVDAGAPSIWATGSCRCPYTSARPGPTARRAGSPTPAPTTCRCTTCPNMRPRGGSPVTFCQSRRVGARGGDAQGYLTRSYSAFSPLCVPVEAHFCL